MKWFWQRRKKDEPAGAGAVAVAPPRAAAVTGRPAPNAELRDDLLRFARDVLVAQGARVRAEEDDLLIATLADGSVARYTTTLARARAEEETTLLAQGAAALETFFDDAAQHARLVALRLSPTSTDPTHIALERLTPLAGAACGRCVGLGGEGWLAGAPTCVACPIRAGRPALTWAEAPVAGRVLRQEEAHSVELVYRLIGRDRRGRRDEWLRLAFDAATGRALSPVEPLLLAAAQPAAQPSASRVALATASARAQETLRPALDTLAALLRQRVADDYQRRVVEVTTTHERLRRERPEETTLIAAALDRELASLAEVYGVEVEARLESAVFITSTVARVAVETARGLGPTVDVDLGRGVVSGPACAVCDEDVRAGHVCAQGHAVCARHAGVCAHCGTSRCPVCEPKAVTCALCGDPTCAACATACDECGRAFCALHTWRCAEGDHTLCLEHVSVCEACGDPLCAAHTSLCGACGASRCQRHARACKTCGEARCEAHALTCVTCGEALCHTHATRCDECGQAVCREDTFACLGCGRSLCACAGAAACASCGADYCAACRAEGGACPACRALETATDADLLELAKAAEWEPTINLKRKWQVGHNARARVYIARGLGFEEAWALTDNGEVIETRRKGWLAR